MVDGEKDHHRGWSPLMVQRVRGLRVGGSREWGRKSCLKKGDKGKRLLFKEAL